MRLFQKLFAAASFGLIAMTATASPANPVAGTDYQIIQPAQPTDSGKKVEVTEFFWYSCPHCHAFESSLNEWVKKQGDTIAFKRVPIAFRESFIPQQKLYYTLEAMGKVEELHKKVFDAIHVNRLPLDTDTAIADFVAKQGVDKQKFLNVYNSFGITAKASRAMQLQNAYKINGVPTIAIGGRYLTSPSIVAAGLGRQSEEALQAAALEVMSRLVVKAANERAAGTNKQ
jgi:thiol:disulfide interchange protein DsbA